MVRHDGSEDNTLGPDDCKVHSPWQPSQNTDAKLLIYRLFQEGRVLAQDGIKRRSEERRLTLKIDPQLLTISPHERIHAPTLSKRPISLTAN